MGQAWQGCDAVERGRDCEAVNRDGGRDSQAAGQAGLGLAHILDFIQFLNSRTTLKQLKTLFQTDYFFNLILERSQRVS